MKSFRPILFLFSLVFLLGCFKKGADDPVISLRSRKARITGNWVMISGKRTNNQGQFQSVEFTYTKDKYIVVTIDPSGRRMYEGAASFNLKLNKDGSFEELKTLSLNSNNLILKGNWNFTGGIGSVKNKEQLLIHYEGTTSNVDILYNIRELRNNKLSLYREFGIENNNTKEEFTFEKD